MVKLSKLREDTNKILTKAMTVKILEKGSWTGKLQKMVRLSVADKSRACQLVCFNKAHDSKLKVGNTIMLTNYYYYDRHVVVRKNTKVYK